MESGNEKSISAESRTEENSQASANVDVPLKKNHKRKRANSSEFRPKGKGKIRTPSGTELSNTVKDIRSFFSPKRGNHSTVTSVRRGLKGSKLRGNYAVSRPETRSITRSVKRKLINKSRKLKNNADLLNTSIFDEKCEDDINKFDLFATDSEHSVATSNTSFDDFLTDGHSYVQ